jgi:hypothetical protein
LGLLGTGCRHGLEDRGHVLVVHVDEDLDDGGILEPPEDAGGVLGAMAV